MIVKTEINPEVRTEIELRKSILELLSGVILARSFVNESIGWWIKRGARESWTWDAAKVS